MDADPALRLRPAEESDLADVLAIEAASFSVPWSREAFDHLFTRSDAGVWVAGCDPNEGIVGYTVLWWVDEEADLANLAVDPSLRSRGFGGAILDQTLETARELGIRRLYLEVRKSNEPALRLYVSRGFERVGFRRDYYTRPKEDAEILLKELV